MESGDPTVSLDLLVRSLLALGTTSREIPQILTGRSPADAATGIWHLARTLATQLGMSDAWLVMGGRWWRPEPSAMREPGRSHRR
jgi:hypothetical protein